MKIGAHLSVAGGHHHALAKIVEIGGNCLQLFSTSPRMWKDADLTQDQIQHFVTLKHNLQVDPIYFHATYLINLADTERIGALSKASLIEELKVANHLEIKGSIVHVGSFKTNDALTDDQYTILTTAIHDILSKTPPTTLFIIENAGNRKVGKTFDEIACLIKKLDSPRVRICLDTAHLWAAGYDFSTDQKMEMLLQEFDTKIGLDKLEVIQLNDSKEMLGSFHDRHENIGKGTIGNVNLQRFINHPAIKNLPLILEVPGVNKKGPDKANINRVKRLAST